MNTKFFNEENEIITINGSKMYRTWWFDLSLNYHFMAIMPGTDVQALSSKPDIQIDTIQEEC